MFLNYLSLAILLAGLIAVFYTFIFIHDIPYDIAKRRNHPQAVGCREQDQAEPPTHLRIATARRKKRKSRSAMAVSAACIWSE